MTNFLITGGSGFIGTHLIRALIKKGESLVSIDRRPPIEQSHKTLWVQCDIKNKTELLKIVRKTMPTNVIHLAAMANLNGRSIDDFPDNTLGTTNVIECINATDSVRHLIHTSTQYVVRPGIYPETDDYLKPYTAYGESKAASEIAVRQNCRKKWTIIRPTNIWGPLHPFFPRELWRYLAKRYYLHPGFKPIRKYYGYVGNAIEQILALVTQGDIVVSKVFYITDEPIDSYDWMNTFSLALSKKSAQRIPSNLWRLMAVAGDVLKRTGLKSPVDSERYFRLTVNETVPHEKTLNLVGPPKYSLADGVRQSVDWYEKQYIL